jgi:hypothetical protein
MRTQQKFPGGRNLAQTLTTFELGLEIGNPKEL